MADVIIIGARVAGASCAMLLGRQNYDVLLLERGRIPTKPKPATNVLHPPAVARLRRWGLLDEVLIDADAPKITHYGLHTGEVDMIGRLPAVDGVDFGLTPRRESLDDILVRAAVDSGVQLRTGVSVQSLLRDEDGVVIGVRARDHNGDPIEEYAPLVIGADGANSKVAVQVGAKKTYDLPVLGKSYFSYWRGDSLAMA